MKYLYLDESGDLGSSSKFFTITILEIDGVLENRKLIKAVQKTIKRKLGSRTRQFVELKGSAIVFSIKEYFYNQVKNINFNLYSVTLDKKHGESIGNKEKIYNFLAKKVIDFIPLETGAKQGINLVIDRSKTKSEIEVFNNYIFSYLRLRTNNKIIIDIEHSKSEKSCGLQACDVFCNGIFQKHERSEVEWFYVFKKEKIKSEELIKMKGVPYGFLESGQLPT